MKAIYAVPATFALVYRAWSHQSLTHAGIAAAVMTAIAHAYHPWNLPFALLCVFFLAGTRATKVCALLLWSGNFSQAAGQEGYQGHFDGRFPRHAGR